MNGLEALKEIKKVPTVYDSAYKRYLYIDETKPEEVDIIEQELKAYYDLCNRMGITDVVKEDFIQLWKEYKALEIIKKHGSNYTLHELKISCDYEEYNLLSLANHHFIEYDNEEYDLLKEVLL